VKEERGHRWMRVWQNADRLEQISLKIIEVEFEELNILSWQTMYLFDRLIKSLTAKINNNP
jgi:hypothetical protein